MMVAVRHENVVRCLGICAVPPCIVTEFCPRGSLFNLLQAARGSPEVGAALGWARRLRMVGGHGATELLQFFFFLQRLQPPASRARSGCCQATLRGCLTSRLLA